MPRCNAMVRPKGLQATRKECETLRARMTCHRQQSMVVYVSASRSSRCLLADGTSRERQADVEGLEGYRGSRGVEE